MSYRENQNSKSPFDVLDSKGLQNQSNIHAEELRRKAQGFINETLEKYPHNISDALESVKKQLVRIRAAYIKPLSIIEYRRDLFLSAEQEIINTEIIQWFIQNFSEKGFEVKRTGSELIIEFKKEQEKVDWFIPPIQT